MMKETKRRKKAFTFMEQAENITSPLADLEQRLRLGETFHIGKSVLWYHAEQQLFFLRAENGEVGAHFAFDRALWTQLNTVGSFQPTTEQEQSTRLYTTLSLNEGNAHPRE